MAKDHGPSVKDDKQYEGLRKKGMEQGALSGSVFFVAIVAVGVVVATATGTIFLLVPFVAIALAAVLVPIVFGALRGTRLEPGASDSHGGVPSTSEASYEPVQQPRRP